MTATVRVGDIQVTDAAPTVRIGTITVADSGGSAVVRVGEIVLWEIADSEYFDGTQWVAGSPPEFPPAAVKVTATPDVKNSPPRVLIELQGLSGTTATVTRVDATGVSLVVRTGSGVVLNGGSAFLYDYEPPYGQYVNYVVASDAGDSGDSGPVMLDPGASWLIHPGIPSLSVPLYVMNVGDRTRPLNQAVLRALGRRDPIVVTDGQRGSASFDLQLGTRTLEEEAAMLSILDDGSPLLLQIASESFRRSYYGWVAVADVTEAALIPYFGSEIMTWALPCTEVSAPIGGVLAQRTNADVAAQFPGYTYAQMKAVYATWRDAYLDIQQGR